MIPKFRVWDTVKKSMSEVQAIVYTEEKVYPVYYKAVRRYVPFSEAVLMQSTGLFDINGKEIFEGDIVKCYTVTEKGEYEYVGVVCLKDFAFVIVDEKDTYDPLWNYKSGFVGIETEIEIIGNVFENTELLEEK